ncbi:MOSC and FAD-binding oxidoreductase domain-containing protein [Undibacterium parvum]|uniref:MOSC domain-containing protein n=2 Tax=Undibacterium TaxID=401469 RepID=A0A6M4A0Z6_9BURK|nr:MOSC and FAD-binding oxidoreductase domain-containing protein [Undibacterium parvum]AZP14056.1 MOSC domain-containing protein [Undibacterium parvum]QJQ05002.1 MOSC domain-containing protein [Undibacterium piscinae]
MVKLRAIFSGISQTYSVDGYSFETAIIKQQVVGTVQVTDTGIVGNQVANHKNAVYAYCSENYAYWNRELDLATPWQCGSIGENLSLQGLDESQLRIGDFLQIGPVLLQVSGCRAPCENFLWRVAQPLSFLAKFQSSGRTGFYLEVISTGLIEAGMLVQHIACQHDSITVPELARFLMQPQAEAQELDRLIAIPGMGQQMLSALVAARNLQIEKALVQRNRWNGWKNFVVSDIVSETEQIKSFYLSPAVPGEQVAGYRAGQFLSCRLTLPNGKQISRCWSISSYDENLQRYRISVKREELGEASSYLHQQLQIGMQIEVMAPSGYFTLKRGEVAVPVVLISAGIGITPMLSMLKAHLARLDKRLPTLYFIHSTQNKVTHAFRQEVDTLVAAHAQLHTHYIHTQPSLDSLLGVDFDSDQRLSSQCIESVMADLGCWFAEKWISLGPADCQYYLCGPDSFQRDVMRMLEQLGVAPHAIFHESFDAKRMSLSELQLADASVRFQQSDSSAHWSQSSDMSLLELAESSGLSPNFSCRNGHCGVCRSTLLQGEVIYPRAPAISLAAGEVLLCCAIPKGDVTLAI